MGRERARKPRRNWGSGGLNADTVAHLDALPQPELFNKETIPDLGPKLVMICLDPAVMMLRRDRDKCGREGFYQVAREKGLTTVQARKLEGVLVLLDNIRYAQPDS